MPYSPRKERIAFDRKIWLACLSLSLCFSTAFILGHLFTEMILLFCVKALPVKCQNEKKMQFWCPVTASAGSYALVHQRCGQFDNVNITKMRLGLGRI